MHHYIFVPGFYVPILCIYIYICAYCGCLTHCGFNLVWFHPSKYVKVGYTNAYDNDIILG